MIYIRQHEAELLSYLTGRAPVGAWVAVPRTEIIDDLVLRNDRLSQLLRALIDNGLIERDMPGQYRVLRRLEDSGVEIVGKELPVRRKTAPSKPKPKIRYVGYDAYQSSHF